jgi:hypothetical protein
VADLAFSHQFGQRVNGLFDGRAGVHPVLVVEVDVSVPRRFSDPSTARRMLAGVLSGAEPPVWEISPNLVASTTSSRCPCTARPTSLSLMKGPYPSAVSIWVTPRSRARWIVRIDSSSNWPAPV